MCAILARDEGQGDAKGMAAISPQRSLAACNQNGTLISIGYGLHMSWVSCLFYQGMLPAAVGNAAAYYQFYLASMSVLVVSLAAFGRLAGKAGRQAIFSRKPLMVVFAVLMCMGTFACAKVGLDDPSKTAPFALSALATGIGSAWYSAAWGLQMVRLKGTDTIVSLCCAYILSAFLYYVASHMPAGAFLAITAISPIGSAAALGICSGTAIQDDWQEPTEKDESLVQDSRVFGIKILQAALLFGIVLGSIQGLMNAQADMQQMGTHSSVLLVCLTIPLAAIVVYLKATKSQSSPIERFVMVYRIALLTMVGALLISSVEGKPSAILHVVMLSGYTFFKIVVWSLLCQLGRSGGIHPVRIISCGEAILSFALLMGNLTLQTLSSAGMLSDGLARSIIALCVALLLVAYIFILTERRIIAIEELGKAKEAELPRGRFRDHFDALVRHYGLTPREADVARLFVRGRSTSRIAEDLYISTGTVATHLRNAYHKTQVHSRQELLDLVEHMPQGQKDASSND